MINTNKNNISENLKLINTNKNNISENLKLINTNKNDISENLKLINSLETKVTSNYTVSQINKSKLDLKSDIIDNHTSKLIEINTNVSNNTSNIIDKLNKLNEILQLLKYKIPQKTFKKSFSIENKEFNFDRTSHFFEIFSTDIENDFIKDEELRISSKIYYEYNNLSNDITRLCHEYQLYSKDGLIHTLVFNHQLRLIIQPIFYILQKTFILNYLIIIVI